MGFPSGRLPVRWNHWHDAAMPFRFGISLLVLLALACSRPSHTSTPNPPGASNPPSKPPGMVTLSSTSPASPSNVQTPVVHGTSDPVTTVKVFGTSDCHGAALGSGQAGQDGSFAVRITVPANTTTVLHATATASDGIASACSTSALSYTEDNGSTMPTSGWRGPATSIETVPGTNEVFLNIAGQRYRPVFVSVNPQAITDEATGWQTLLAEIDLASQQGMPVIDLMLANHSTAFLDQLSQELGNRQVYLWLRFDMWIPELANVGVPQLEDLGGDSQPGYRVAHALSTDGIWSTIPFYSTMDQSWLDAEKQFLVTLLNNVSQSGIGDRVIGIRPTYLAGGEWFQPPLAFHDGTLDESPPNEWPWSNPDAFSVGDYSASEQSSFSQWLSVSGFDSTLPFPTPADRIQPKLGRSFIIGADGTGLQAALYHRFLSERIVTFQNELAATAKLVTGAKALTMVNNGYLISLCYYNGSLHTAMDSLLNSSSIDAIAAPYNYDTAGTRAVGSAFIPHGPMDSPALHGKLWIHEDDSRPYWSTDGFRTTTSAAEDLAMLMRNAVTSLIHGNGLYFFDLPNQGWFGGNLDHASEVQTVYSTLLTVKSSLDGQLGTSGPVKPEIAVFMDDTSYQLYPEFGMDGANSYGTSNDLMLRMIEKLSGEGAPIRYYLLDDLANPNLDVSSFKLVVFLNTPRLTQAQRQTIQTRLMNSSRMLYFQYVTGLFDESLMPSWSLAAPYSLGVSSLSDIEASTSMSVMTSNQGGYVLAYSPRGADQASIDALVAQAGVHRYATGAIVDGVGSLLMVHATGGSVPVSLNAAAKVVDLATGAALCSNCTSLTLSLAGPETHVLSLQPPVPIPTGRLFRYEFTPGSVGGCITYDEQTYCGLPDGNALHACGFTDQDYENAPITPYGQLTLTYNGQCMCQ